MPMENIKQRLSDVAHNWSYIGMITLFLFTVQPGPTTSQALTVETPKSLKQAWAIAKSESNARPMAYNGNRKTGDSSYGIFQINMLGELGIDRKEKFELRSNILLFDPVINAEITYYMTKGGTDWSSWSSLNGARYKEFLLEFQN